MHKDTDQLSEIYKFTQDFFQLFGAKVQKQGRKKAAPLEITLSPQFASTFGYSTLQLVFTPDELANLVRPENQIATLQVVEQPPLDEPQAGDAGDASTGIDPSRPKHGVELVARGSRIFDHMLTYLDKRSALTMQRLPSKFTGGEELMAAIRPVNTSIAKLNMQEQLLNLYIYNWHVTYRADDKYEEILTVAIDDNGNLYPLVGTVGETAKVADADLLHLDELLTDGEPIEQEVDEDGTLKPVSLPPMTELTRLAETSRKYAIYHADVRCVAHEVEVQQRLYRVLNRLNNYYMQQIEEVYDSHDQSGEKRSTLERDLQRKISEEVENHRLRVQVRLFSYAIVQVPIAIADLSLTDGKQETAVRVRRNQYSGALQRPPCHACGIETTNVTIDRNGHLSCDDCAQKCGNCHDVLCADCGVAPCSVCQKENCDTCGKECWACGERACSDHISECPSCRDAVCHTCQSECAECGIRQCRSHLRVDCVVSTTDGEQDEEQTEEHALVCASCAVHCLGCAQYSAQIDTCEKSGQRFCKNCLETCHDCGTRIGPDYYVVNPLDKEIYCRDCVTICPACDSSVAELTACQECSADCCANCSAECESCQATVCADHRMNAGVCGHVFCTAHGQHCAIGSEPVCAICDAVCSICQRPYCAHHADSCGLCRCAYCTDCMVEDNGLCHTCATIREDGRVVDLSTEPIADHPDVAPFIHGYRWTVAANLHYTIYLGEGPFNTGALVLVQNETDGPPPRNLAPKRQSQSRAGSGNELFGSLVDKIIGGTDFDSIGENLKRALLKSGLLDDRPDLAARLQSDDPEPTAPEPTAPEPTAPDENAGPQVLVARKINGLDLIWRGR